MCASDFGGAGGNVSIGRHAHRAARGALDGNRARHLNAPHDVAALGAELDSRIGKARCSEQGGVEGNDRCNGYTCRICVARLPHLSHPSHPLHPSHPIRRRCSQTSALEQQRRQRASALALHQLGSCRRRPPRAHPQSRRFRDRRRAQPCRRSLDRRREEGARLPHSSHPSLRRTRRTRCTRRTCRTRCTCRRTRCLDQILRLRWPDQRDRVGCIAGDLHFFRRA